MELELTNDQRKEVEAFVAKKIVLNDIEYKPKASSEGIDIPLIYFDGIANKVCYLRISMDVIEEALKTALERTNVVWPE